MKKPLLISLTLVLALMASSVWAIGDYGVYSKEQVIKIVSEFLNQPEKEPVFRCPVSKISDQDQCFTCHTRPTFKIKEANPDDLYEYPNMNTKIRIVDGEKRGFLFINDINAEIVKSALDYFEKHQINHITFEIHSPGGSLFDAWRIAGLMGEAEVKGKIIETQVFGFAASAGFLIAISGTKGHRYASTNAELMWHELWTFTFFKLETPSSKEEEARVLRHLQDTGNNWLASRCNLSKEEIDKLVKNKEFWMTGLEAKGHGFIDHILDAPEGGTQ
jgi:ATP-dependent Clp protease protease subunit